MTLCKAPFIIAEAGINHNGRLDLALQMVDVAAQAGADCVKFQAFDANNLTAVGTKTAKYQARNTGQVDQREMLKSLEFRLADFERIAERCATNGIEFLCTAFDLGMVERLIEIGMRRIKIASGELTNTPALRRFGELGLPVILSTGMATDSEVDEAILVLKRAGAKDITVLQCTSIYPAPISEANLRAMVEMGVRNDVAFGYSDHTIDDHVSIAAVALGACIIEKHFTLDTNLPGPDHLASIEPHSLARMVRRLQETSLALGDGAKNPSSEELETAKLVRRSWHASRDLQAGSVLTNADLVLKRPADGLPPAHAPLGRRLRVFRAADEAIRKQDVENDK